LVLGGPLGSGGGGQVGGAGGAEGDDVQLREDLPTPQAGPDQLLIRVQASSVNPVDTGIAAGYLQAMFPYEFPVVLGRDYAGVIEQVGPAVTGYAPRRRGLRMVAARQPNVA
jgi:NADPH:quinone reductase-like Zn-dependent oxidoreductase